MKYLLIIGDGMADNPVPALGDKTPLEVADKPVIDDLARKGVLGSTVNCPKEFEPGSATAIMSIFGASPLEYYHGRGPLEAAAQGIALSDGDMACRCNMVRRLGEGIRHRDQPRFLLPPLRRHAPRGHRGHQPHPAP